jgi:ATP-dependent DNA helicase RecG
MTVFGDLETSTLTELPKGRAPIETYVVPTTQVKFFARVWEIVRREVAAGRQAYVVCARIGETGGSDGDGSAPVDDDGQSRPPAAAVLDVEPRLKDHELHGLRIESLHGQLPPETKEDVMRRFSAGDIDVLVATTVVEVGVDVPNATVMVVMDADRFGVSQLHQLRGRVGRGSEPSICFLVTDLGGGPARERLDAVASTLDGFALSEVDLRQRREGDLLGAAQSGRRKALRFLSIIDDGEVIAAARDAATALVAGDPELSRHPALLAVVEELTADEKTDYLERS